MAIESQESETLTYFGGSVVIEPQVSETFTQHEPETFTPLNLTVTRKRALSSPTVKDDTKRLHTSIMLIPSKDNVTRVSISSVSSDNGSVFTPNSGIEEDFPPGQGEPDTSKDTGTALLEAGHSENSDMSQSSDMNMISVPSSMLEDILAQLKQLNSTNNQLVKTVQELGTEVKQLKANRYQPPPAHSNVQTQPVHRRSNNHNSRDKILNLKQKVLPDWGSRFSERRKEFKAADKNIRQAEIYTEFLKGDGDGIPFIVKKFRPTFARDAHDYALAESDSIHKMQTQCKRWARYAELARGRYTAVDAEVNFTISKHPVQSERDLLLKTWKEEVKVHEEKAYAMNESELEFMINMRVTDPYTGYRAAATTQRPDNSGFYKKNFYNEHRQVREQAAATRSVPTVTVNHQVTAVKPVISNPPPRSVNVPPPHYNTAATNFYPVQTNPMDFPFPGHGHY